MTRPSTSGRDPHRRFADWLLAATDDDPPRDLAVHASLCPECQLQIAAFDMLTAIDLARAEMPPSRAHASKGRLGTPGRVAVAVGGAAAMAAIGVGGWRLAEAGGLTGQASEAPTQEVLGNTGHPPTTPAVSPSAGAPATTAESADSQSPKASPRASASSGALPLPPPPAATARPTTTPTKTPKPSIIAPSPTPLPTPVVTPTPDPTADPTPEPSPSAAEAA
jgi:hypothetical protein